jgi:hypothetical protein
MIVGEGTNEIQPERDRPPTRCPRRTLTTAGWVWPEKCGVWMAGQSTERRFARKALLSRGQVFDAAPSVTLTRRSTRRRHRKAAIDPLSTRYPFAIGPVQAWPLFICPDGGKPLRVNDSTRTLITATATGYLSTSSRANGNSLAILALICQGDVVVVCPQKVHMTDRPQHGTADGDVKRKFGEALERKRRTASRRRQVDTRPRAWKTRSVRNGSSVARTDNLTRLSSLDN